MDDFLWCNAGEEGLARLLGHQVDNMGIVRPMRFPVASLLALSCTHLDLGLMIGLTLGLTIAAALLLVGLLRDLHVPGQWPYVGGALFLLFPLGAESALWPSAMHIPLGLCAALIALRLYLREKLVLGAAAALVASFSIEQVIFALPLAAWLITPPRARRRVLGISLLVTAGVVAAYAAWPGTNPRTAVALGQRFGNIVKEPAWYVTFPARPVGIRSMPLAVAWAFPWSAIAVMVSGFTGFRFGRSLLGESSAGGRARWRILFAGLAIIALVNLPGIVTVGEGVGRDDSPRVFTPTWLVLAGLAAVLGANTQWQRPRIVAGLAGCLAAAALLSFAFNVSVRVEQADAVERAFDWIGSQVSDGAVVSVCDVRRTFVEPAPVGAVAQTEFLFDWSAEEALRYYTGVRAQFELGGHYWDNRCPPGANRADLVVSFDDLLTDPDSAEVP